MEEAKVVKDRCKSTDMARRGEDIESSMSREVFTLHSVTWLIQGTVCTHHTDSIKTAQRDGKMA